tara:strand:+ start:280 stop:525 length:246 start_codon:yes stop_codon:yes gene_type:complete
MNKVNFDKNQLDTILEVVQEAIRDLPGGSDFDPYDEELMEADPASFAGCLRDIEIKIKKFQDESDDGRPLFGDFTTTCEPD